MRATIEPRRAAAWMSALVWLLCAAMLIYIGRFYIETINFHDPDDALRLVEVRDWMAGQSWFDVTQYRSHPPLGAPMHWSRLVDVPIAFFISVYGLFASPVMAERLALVTVPLLMLGGLFAILHRLSVRMTGLNRAGVVAAVMLATSVGVLVQFQPMRIDHHGWQITLTMLAIWLMIGREGQARRNAALAGLVMAVNLTIAIESLPLAAALGAVLALRYLRRADALGALFAYVLTLGGVAALLLPVMLGWRGAVLPWCDSLSPAYAAPLLVVGLVLGFAMRIVPQSRLWQRLACLAIAGSAGALLIAGATPQCLHGPFSSLDPLIYAQWYVTIKEGMPIWTQPVDLQILVPLPSILGLIGTLLAVRFDAVERRERWIELAIVQFVAFAVSMMVMRAMGLAHVVAMPGNAWLFLSALAAAMRLTTRPGRVLAGFFCFALLPLGAEVVSAALLPNPDGPQASNKVVQKDEGPDGSSDICATHRGFAQLDRIAPAEFLTPLDIASHILVFTHHSVVATGHHRNREGMKTVVSALIAEPDQARAIIATTASRYVALCPMENEAKRFAAVFPHSLTAALVHNRAPAWLQRIPLERKDDLLLYRIVN
ncbi:MAG: STT3 domain-containing protein [Sphingobium sp.]